MALQDNTKEIRNRYVHCVRPPAQEKLAVMEMIAQEAVSTARTMPEAGVIGTEAAPMIEFRD